MTDDMRQMLDAVLSQVADETLARDLLWDCTDPLVASADLGDGGTLRLLWATSNLQITLPDAEAMDVPMPEGLTVAVALQREGATADVQETQDGARANALGTWLESPAQSHRLEIALKRRDEKLRDDKLRAKETTNASHT